MATEHTADPSAAAATISQQADLGAPAAGQSLRSGAQEGESPAGAAFSPFSEAWVVVQPPPPIDPPLVADWWPPVLAAVLGAACIAKLLRVLGGWLDA